MAKKKIKSEDTYEKVKDFFTSGFFALLKDFFTNVIIIKVDGWLKDLSHKIRNSIYMAVSLIFAVLFIFLAIIFLAEEYLGLNYGWSFLIFGVALLFISFIFHISIKGDE